MKGLSSSVTTAPARDAGEASTLVSAFPGKLCLLLQGMLHAAIILRY